MSKRYMVGPPGSGKTGELVRSLASLLEQRVRCDRILVLVPQQAQARRFEAAVAQTCQARHLHSKPAIETIYSLAQKHVSLFFPLIAPPAGFSRSVQEPLFINIEAAQYFVDRLVQPRAEDFADLRMSRPRLARQILDNMNKAAVCGFPLEQIAERLSSAWAGEPSRLLSYQRAQDVALAFRHFCLQQGLLDFSLLMDVFGQHLLPSRSYQDYVAAHYRHVVADNLEEQPPIAHDFLRLVLRTSDSAVLVEDEPGGYRLFLGADPVSARELAAYCDQTIRSDHVFVAPPAVVSFGQALQGALSGQPISTSRGDWPAVGEGMAGLSNGASWLGSGDRPGIARYWAEMVDWVARQIERLLAADAQPADIAVLAPFVEDVLRFELQERLRSRGVGVRALRPSRPLYDHPTVRAMLALARLAHPHWQWPLTPGELARALASVMADLDAARAHLLAEAISRVGALSLPELSDSAVWQRIGERFGERYAILQRWMSGRDPAGRDPDAPLDVFWQRLFNEILTQAGFALHRDHSSAVACDKLIQGARAFRQAMERAASDHALFEAEANDIGTVPGIAPKPSVPPAVDAGLEYIVIVSQGLFGAQHPDEHVQEQESQPDTSSPNEIVLAPVYAYLTNDFRSRYQFWLEINSLGWWQRIYQPLTHPYVLSRRWQTGTRWTDADEQRAGLDMLSRIIGGLVYRCAGHVFLTSSRLGIDGQEESGPLERAAQRVIERAGK
ncbi:MAG: hypothetical protein RMN25_06585 [Anaerolineae bacterium]|nr:hypothetical protein [Thermoflexales bacterium]MDW8407436.1 hypothetical protein [Anaerolineae bacterium]